MSRFCLIAVLCSLLLCGCSSNHRAEISVTGSAGEAMVTYMIGGEQSQTTERLPFSHTFDAPSGTVISASAQNQGDTGKIDVKIMLDGKRVAGGSAGNPYGVATAAHAVPGPDFITPGIVIGLVLSVLGAVGKAQSKSGASSTAPTSSETPKAAFNPLEAKPGQASLPNEHPAYLIIVVVLISGIGLWIYMQM